MPNENWGQRAVAGKSVAGLLSRIECEELIRQAGEIGLARAKVVQHGDVVVSKLRTHDNTVLPLEPQRQWLHDRILFAAREVNQDLWRFDIESIDAFEILRYRPGQQFKWHFDTHSRFRRKITCVVNLSDPASYWRGGLVLRGAHLEKKVAREQGSATLFPSYVEHRARSPWLGTRWSLVAWLNGPEFR
jgi:PKHD-type hydroxylase